MRWQKRIPASEADDNQEGHVDITSSTLLHINYLQLEDAGVYECVVQTEYGIGVGSFELYFTGSNSQESSSLEAYGSDSESEYDGNFIRKKADIKLVKAQNESKIEFRFVQKEVSPRGIVDVICEAGKTTHLETWSLTRHLTVGDRLDNYLKTRR